MTVRRLLAGLLPTTLLLVALPAPADAAPIMYPSGVGVDLGPTPTTLGVKPAAGEDPTGLQTGTEQGKTYWRTNRAANTEFLSFDVDRDYVEALSTNDVVVTVTYLDAGSGVLKLQYDAEADPATNATAIPLTGTGQWKTGTFELKDVEFADRLGGADVRLTGDADITIAALRISTFGATVQLGATPQQAGISVRAGDRGEDLITGTEQGRPYWQTNLGAGFFYLNVSDTFLYDNRNLVLISIDYFDEGNGRLGLHYDSPGDELIDKFKPSAVFQYGDTKTWQTYTFALDDAVMTNRSNGSDLRIHVGDGTVKLKVAAVRIAKVATTLNLTEGLQNLITEAARVEKAAREGTRDGQFPVGSRAILRTAIDKARAVAAKPGVTDTEVKAALYELDGSLAAFRTKAVDTNIATTGTASASSGANPSQANDGNPATAWTSDTGTTGEWLQVDLGTARAINDVRVNWAGAYSPDYAVALSTDGASFTPVGRIGSPGGNQTSRTRFATTPARYVRVVLDHYAPGGNTFAVKELQVRNVRVPTPQSKLVQTVNPTEDGVIADFDVTGVDRTGKADATKAIQRALYDCQDAGGGTVWLPVGKYRVTDTLEVHPFCTLRGDRRDPDVAHGNYGTLVIADLPTGGDDLPLFRIGGSAGVMGLTTYYPRQNATNPVPYGYTFEVPGNAWIGNENYMMSTISDITMLNSYKGIGISTFANDRGGSPGSSQVHESTTIRNVKGTVLFEGTRAYNGADVGTWENVTFSNAYWAAVPGAPTRAAIDAWTRANGTGFVLGDLEWDQFHRISASDYKVGIHVVTGQRASFTGSFLQPDIRRTTTAVLVDSMDERWGMTFAGGRLEGKIQNDSRGYVKITGTDVQGETSGTVYRMAGAAPSYTPGPLPSPSRRVLYSAAQAPRGVGYLPAADATKQIQKALDKAGQTGGIVYLPAGWYRISTRLRVPAGVELRGASAVPNRDQSGTSGGTVLHAFEGRNAPATAPALITLDGNRAGVRGLRAFYPDNNPGKAEGLVPYPYAVRAKGTSTYVVNVGLPNAWNGLDFATYRNDGFVVRKLAGAFFDNTIAVGNSKNGRIEGMLSNGNAVTRVGYQVPHWMTEGDIFALVIDKYMRRQAKLVTVDGATNLKIFNIFGYGFHDGLKVASGEVDVFNIGTDNLGSDGFTVAVAGGDVDVTNVARYNGSTSTGPVKLRNVMAINIVERSVSAVAGTGGTVVLQGNESAPGQYEPGVTVTATAKAAAGYAFRDWTVDGSVVSTSADYAFTVGSTDVVLTANFTTN